MSFPGISTTLIALVSSSVAFAGPFPPAAGLPGTDAVAANDARITLWAAAAEITRGPANIAATIPVEVGFGEPADALGPSDATPDEPYSVVSLGDGGSATLLFSAPFGNVPGPDFVVFENGFSAGFLELAHVEVSSDGEHFFRFPSTSLTPASVNLGEGGSVDPTNIRNLAGKYLAGFGTPFDLAELRHLSPDLDIERVTHVRVIDVIGTNDPAHATYDAGGFVIVDPYPTNFFTGGFDLDAVGAISTTSTTYAAWTTARGLVGGDALPTADPEHNGVANLIEYLTGSAKVEVEPDPLNGANLTFSRLSYRTGGNLRVEASSDLVHWSSIAESTDGGPLVPSDETTRIREAGDALKQVSLQFQPSPTTRYYRLAAQLIPAP